MKRTLFLLATTLLRHLVSAAIVDNRCSIFTFLPFSVRHNETRLNVGLTGAFDVDDYDFPEKHLLGFSQMAAALMAVDHFNTRDPSVVPELANLGDCSIQLDLAGIYDSDQLDHDAVQTLWELDETPCALAGPYWDIPGLELSVVATAMQIPMVVHRSFNSRLLYPVYSPFTTVTYPSLEAGTTALADFMTFTNRSTFVSFLAAVSDGGIQTKSMLASKLESLDYTVSEHSYTASINSWDLNHSQSLFKALKGIMTTGFTKIVVAPDYPALAIPAIADAAAQLKMFDPPYLWIWFGPFEYKFQGNNNTNITKLLQGSIWITPVEGLQAGDPFYEAWRKQNSSMVDRMDKLNPIKSKSVYKPSMDLFQKNDPQPGSGFLYDSIMSIGIGACLAANKTDSRSHMHGIQQVKFSGVTGTVQYGAPMYVDGFTNNTTTLPGARLPSSVTWTAANVVPSNDDNNKAGLELVYAAIYNGTWIQKTPFLYANNQSTPPPLYEPDPNYLTRGIRAGGLTLMSIVLLMGLMTFCWVYKNKQHRILAASQPFFLNWLAFGSMVSSISILTISFDEGSGWSVAQLGKACMSTMWLVTLGYIITYGALFSKLWRVNQVLQGTRRKVSVYAAAIPAGFLVVMALIILSVWTGVDSLYWERTVVDSSTGESFGNCAGDNVVRYLIPLVGVVLLSLGLTAFMAYKTKDVDDAYSESFWILILIGVQFEIVLVGLPVEVILQDVNPNIRYLVLSFVLFLLPLSTLLLIVLPKVVAHRRAVLGITNVKRGARAQGKVSGMEEPSQKVSTASQECGRPTTSNSAFVPSTMSFQPPGNSEVLIPITSQTLPEGSDRAEEDHSQE